jgi:4-diphosphocytidyl-2C-methyl-D-erythritol kinase
MEGYGEKLTPLEFAGGYSLLIAVPDLYVPTAEVYRRWDEMGGPRGEERALEALPEPLRPYGPFRNDLEPAAVDLHPELATYRTRLETEFGRTFFFSGSGPTMFAFLDVDEEVGVSSTNAQELGLRALFITNPYENGASVTDR